MREKMILPLIMVVFSCLIFPGCGDNADKNSPDKKVLASLADSNGTDIYDVLIDYPALDSFFKENDLRVSKFEQRLFGDFLGNKKAADIIVALIDLFPDLIDIGTTATAGMFTAEIEAEMEGKGPIPDLMSAISVLTENVLAVENEKIQPFYHYLDKLDEMENVDPESPELADYYIEILLRVLAYLKTLDKDSINLFMNLAVKDYMECKIPVDGKLDYADYEELIEKFTQKAPGGVSKILQGLKTVFYDDEIKSEVANLFHAVGDFMGEEQSYPLIKALIENIHQQYSVDALGKIIDGMWDAGPKIGPKVEVMGIEDYGKSGSAPKALKAFLSMEKSTLNHIIEAMYAFLQEGYNFDKVDEQLKFFVDVDTFFFDRKGEGEYGNGKFHEPRDNFSYKDFSCLRGFLGLARRWSIPTNLTTTLISEGPNAEATTKFLRAIFPNADDITFASCIWAERYEKGDGYYMGHGKPVTEKRGYGLMIDGVFVDPVGPAILLGGTIAFNMIGDSLINGPHDNIYDNVIWWYAKRKLYIVIDMMQFLPEIPELNALLGPFFKRMGIQSVPIIALEGTFQSVFYLELKQLLQKLPEAMTQSLIKVDTPEWMVNMAVNMVKAYLPMGYPDEGTDRLYLLPPDYMDLDVLVPGFAYCDPDAFHLDRYLNPDNYEDFSNYYDVRDFTYTKNKDSVDHLLDVLAPAIIGMYKAYQDVVSGYPSTYQAVADRQEAAKKAFSGAIHPCDLFLNILAALSEGASEESVYTLPEKDTMQLVKLLEPLIQMESIGVMDTALKIAGLLGKPGLKDARLKIIDGIGEVLQTIEDNSRSPYTLANEILECTEKALADPRRWETMKLMLGTLEGLLSKRSEHQIVDELVGLVNHLTRVDMSNDEWALAADGIIEIFEKSTGKKVLTRALIHLTTILDAIDQKHIWNDALYALNEALAPNGVMNYVLSGMERNPDFSWNEILEDTNEFFHSDLMLKYEEGTFWKDVYYFLDFIAEALE